MSEAAKKITTTTTTTATATAATAEAATATSGAATTSAAAAPATGKAAVSAGLEAFKSRTAVQMNWRVLIVEDEPSIAHGIKNILTPSGGNVIPMTSRSSRQSAPLAQVPVQPTVRDQFDVTWAK